MVQQYIFLSNSRCLIQCAVPTRLQPRNHLLLSTPEQAGVEPDHPGSSAGTLLGGWQTAGVEPPNPTPHQFKHWMTDKFQYSSKFQVQIYVFVAHAPSSLYVRLWTRSHSLHACHDLMLPERQVNRCLSYLGSLQRLRSFQLFTWKFFQQLMCSASFKNTNFNQNKVFSIERMFTNRAVRRENTSFFHPEKLICM